MEVTTDPATSQVADPGAVHAPWAGLTVLVTGVVAGLSRDGAVEAVTALGARSVTAVSGKVDIVVAGEGAGVSKMEKARRFGCRILPGETFAALVRGEIAFDETLLVPANAWGATDAEPEQPSDPASLADRHLITLFTDHYRENDQWNSRFRLRCQCGHLWVEPIQWSRRVTCPVGAGLRAAPNTTPPWPVTPRPAQTRDEQP